MSAWAREERIIRVTWNVFKKIRTSIFGLHQPRQATAGLPARVMEIIDEHTAQLGFTVGVRFAGPLDPGPDEALAHDILAVTREAMSNCARHARSSGLSSMRRRAERNGGTFQLITP